MLAWMAAAALADPVKIVNVGSAFVRVYALVSGDAVVLVEASNPGHEDDVLAKMAAEGIDEDEVTALVLTHGHPDHAGSATALSDLLDVPVIAGEADRPYLEAGTAPIRPTGSRGWLIKPLVHHTFPPVSLDVAVVDRLDLSPWGVPGELRVVGGHTPGSLVVDLHDGNVFVGDLIRGHLFRKDVPALHFFQDDPLGADQALRAVIASGATTIWPTHGAPMPAERVEAWLETHGIRYDARFAKRATQTGGA